MYAIILLITVGMAWTSEHRLLHLCDLLLLLIYYSRRYSLGRTTLAYDGARMQHQLCGLHLLSSNTSLSSEQDFSMVFVL